MNKNKNWVLYSICKEDIDYVLDEINKSIGEKNKLTENDYWDIVHQIKKSVECSCEDWQDWLRDIIGDIIEKQEVAK